MADGNLRVGGTETEGVREELMLIMNTLTMCNPNKKLSLILKFKNVLTSETLPV